MKALIFSIGLAVFSIGLTALTGYGLEEATFYKWNDGVGMALNTAVAFTLTGMALCIIGSRPKYCYGCEYHPKEQK